MNIQKTCHRGILVVLMVFAQSGFGRADRETIRGKFKERFQAVVAMRQAAVDFFAAKEMGNCTTAMEAAEEAKKLWKALPENWQKAIEAKHPGTMERVMNLKKEFDLPDQEPTGVSVSTTGAEGITVTRQDTWTQKGDTVSHEGTATGSGGKSASVDATWVKDGSTVTKDATYTAPNGKTAEQDVTWTKEGGTVTRQGTTTGSEGKSVTSLDTWSKEGSTVERQGSSTTSGGKTATRQDTWVKEGSTVTHDGTRTSFSGSTATKNDTWTKSGNTVTHQGTVSGDRSAAKSWKPHYNDDLDIFGGRPKPVVKKTPVATGGRKK